FCRHLLGCAQRECCCRKVACPLESTPSCQGSALMRLAELVSVGRAPVLPLQLQLPDGELLLRRLLRVLPGQRYVALAEWRGRPVLAKLLVGDKAARHFQREREGARLLAEQGLNTPLLLADGLREGE